MKNSSLKLCEINEFRGSYNNIQFKLLINAVSKRTEGLIMDNETFYVKSRKDGSYGRVYIMRNSKNDDSIVLKRFATNEDYLKEKIISIIISNIQKDCDCKLNIVPSYWYEKDIYNYIVMHYRLGSLNDLIYSNYKYDPFDIFLQVLESVYELYKYGIYYCDIKVANILFKTMNDKIKISLGDLGGVVFSNTNILHNLFCSKDLENMLIKIEKPNNKDNNFNYYLDSKYYRIGNTTLTNKEFYDKEIKIKEISENSAVVYIENEEINMESIYINFDECVFTFPHYRNPTGVICFMLNDSIEYRRNIIMNNIFQSLGMVLVQLLFINYYFMTNDLIGDYYEKSVKKIQKDIDRSNYEFLERLLINEILFGSVECSGLIHKDYIDYKNDIDVKLKFEMIIRKVKVLLSK